MVGAGRLGLLALLVRLAFTFRAPPFVTNDSLSYLLPGFDLVHGAASPRS